MFSVAGVEAADPWREAVREAWGEAGRDPDDPDALLFLLLSGAGELHDRAIDGRPEDDVFDTTPLRPPLPPEDLPEPVDPDPMEA